MAIRPFSASIAVDPQADTPLASYLQHLDVRSDVHSWAKYLVRLILALLVNLFTEPVYDVHDKPRWELDPDVPVLMGGDILEDAMRYLRSA
jgi:hypothetical protein